jgi:hypothetical protein
MAEVPQPGGGGFGYYIARECIHPRLRTCQVLELVLRAKEGEKLEVESIGFQALANGGLVPTRDVGQRAGKQARKNAEQFEQHPGQFSASRCANR